MMLHTTDGIQLLTKLFRGFADPSRMSILLALRKGPLTVTEIVEATGLSQSNASNHLGCLRDCGLTDTRQEGRYVYYELVDDRVSAVLDTAQQLLSDIAAGIYNCTRYTSSKKKPSKKRKTHTV